jgi:hypothetical protein
VAVERGLVAPGAEFEPADPEEGDDEELHAAMAVARSRPTVALAR